MLNVVKATKELLNALDSVKKPQTNADRIRSMSDEELASFIDSETNNCAPHGDCKKVYDDCKACWLYWLQQPAE